MNEYKRDENIVFEFYIDGYFGISHRIIIVPKGDTYQVTHNRYENSSTSQEKQDIEAGENNSRRSAESFQVWKVAHWTEFLQRVTECGIADWNDAYQDMTIMDGTGWDIFCKFDDGRFIESGGSNAFPEEFGRLNKTLHRYIAADIVWRKNPAVDRNHQTKNAISIL